MEREMDSLAKDFKQIEELHGMSVLNLVIAVGYLRSLLDNSPIVRYLASNYPEILTELQKVADSRMLEGESGHLSLESETSTAATTGSC